MLVRGWRRLRSSPADRNEDLKLELSRAWEPSDNSRPMPFGKGKVSHNGFLNRDQTSKGKNGENPMQIGF
jgi:hypothetical protein